MKVRIISIPLYIMSVGLLMAGGFFYYVRMRPGIIEVDPAALASVELIPDEKAGGFDDAKFETARLSKLSAKPKIARRPLAAKPPLATRVRLVAISGRTAVVEDRRTRRQVIISIGEQAFGAKLVGIGKNSVTFEEDGNRKVLGTGTSP